MKSNDTAITGRRRSRTLTALVAAGIMSAVGVGSYAGWTANADERPAVFDDAISQVGINVDSLYSAMTIDEPVADSSAIAAVNPERTITGRVSWYGPGFHGRRTASGERFDRNEMTAAHKTLPFGSLVRVVDVNTGRSVLVRINDRGPYCGGRVLDLSEKAADRLGIRHRGTASVRMELYANPGPAPKDAKAETVTASNLTFDISGRAIVPNGFAVEVGRTGDFDEAIALQLHLRDQGYDNVYMTRIAQGGARTYAVSIGLLSTERLCRSLHTEVAPQFKTSSIVRFQQGMPAPLEAVASIEADSSRL